MHHTGFGLARVGWVLSEIFVKVGSGYAHLRSMTRFLMSRQSQNATKPRDSDIHVKAEVHTLHGLWFGASRLGSERDICESRLVGYTPSEYDKIPRVGRPKIKPNRVETIYM